MLSFAINAPRSAVAEYVVRHWALLLLLAIHAAFAGLSMTFVSAAPASGFLGPVGQLTISMGAAAYAVLGQRLQLWSREW